MPKDIKIAIKGMDQISAPLKKIKGNLSSFGSQISQPIKNAFNNLSLKTHTRSFEKIKNGFGGLAESSKQLAVVSGGLTTGIGFAIKAASDFEGEMSVVKSLIGDITNKEFKDLQNEAKRLGATTSFSARDTSKGFQYLALAGLSVKDSLKVLEPVLRTAEAGSLDLALTTDIITDSMSTLGRSFKDINDKVKNATQLSNYFALAQSKSNTNIEQLGEAVKYGGSSLSNLGVPLRQIIASFGKLADAGQKGSMGGTGLAEMFKHLIAPVGKAKSAIKELGLSFNKLPLQDVPSLIDTLNNRFDSIKDPAKRARIATELFGIQGKRAFDALSISGGNSLRKLSKELENSEGVAAKMARERMNNTRGLFKSLQSVFSGISIEFGSIFTDDKTGVPILKGLVSSLQELNLAFQYVNGNMKAYGEKASNMTDKQKSLIKFLSDFKSGLIEGIFSVKDLFSTVRENFASIAKIFGVSESETGRLIGKFIILATAIAPIGVALMGLQMALAPFVSIIQIFSGLTMILKSALLPVIIFFGKFVLGALIISLKILTTVLFGIGFAIYSAFGPIGLVIAGIATIATGIAAGAYLIYENWGNIKKFFGNIFDWFKEKLKEFTDLLPEFVLKQLGFKSEVKVINGKAQEPSQYYSRELMGQENEKYYFMNRQEKEVKLMVDFANVPKGVSVEQKKNNADNFELNIGRSFGLL